MRLAYVIAVCALPSSAMAQPLELPTNQTLDWLINFFQGSTSVVQETTDSRRHYLYMDAASTRVMFGYDEWDGAVQECMVQYIDLSVTEGVEHWSDTGCDGVLDQYSIKHTQDGEWTLHDDVTAEHQQEYERFVEFYASNLNLFWNMVSSDLQEQAVAECRRYSNNERQERVTSDLKTVRAMVAPESTLSLQVYGRDNQLFQFTFSEDVEQDTMVYGERTPAGEVRIYDTNRDGFVDEVKRVHRTGRAVVTFPQSITVPRPVFECLGLHRLSMTAALAENLRWFFAK